MKLATHLHLVPRLRMCGAIPPFFHKFLWRTQRQTLLWCLCDGSVVGISIKMDECQVSALCHRQYCFDERVIGGWMLNWKGFEIWGFCWSVSGLGVVEGCKCDLFLKLRTLHCVETSGNTNLCITVSYPLKTRIISCKLLGKELSCHSLDGLIYLLT